MQKGDREFIKAVAAMVQEAGNAPLTGTLAAINRPLRRKLCTHCTPDKGNNEGRAALAYLWRAGGCQIDAAIMLVLPTVLLVGNNEACFSLSGMPCRLDG